MNYEKGKFPVSFYFSLKLCDCLLWLRTKLNFFCSVSHRNRTFSRSQQFLPQRSFLEKLNLINLFSSYLLIFPTFPSFLLTARFHLKRKSARTSVVWVLEPFRLIKIAMKHTEGKKSSRSFLHCTFYNPQTERRDGNQLFFRFSLNFLIIWKRKNWKSFLIEFLNFGTFERKSRSEMVWICFPRHEAINWTTESCFFRESSEKNSSQQEFSSPFSLHKAARKKRDF